MAADGAAGDPPDDWDAEDAKLGTFASWARWVRDDVRIQAAAWLVATVGVLRPESPWALWPGLVDALASEANRAQLLTGWAAATLMTIGWATGRVQLVFTFEQRAMNFPPWSVLVFCKFRRPVIGSVIFFDGCDGRSYVRRVCSVKKGQGSELFVQTIGDLTGAPDDRPLYSLDGSATWLDLRVVRGVMAAGPFSLKVLLCTVVTALALSPTATVAFLATNQPFLAAWFSVIVRFFLVLLLDPVA